MLILRGNIVFCCSKCRLRLRISGEELDCDSETVEMGDMGPRVQHTFDFYGKCAKCGNDMSFRIIGYEYPVGALEYQDKASNGCSLESVPRIEPEYYDFYVPPDCESWVADDVARLIDLIKSNRDYVYSLTSRQFEEFVAEVFRRNGYTTELTPPARDGGKDVIATINNGGVSICLYIECKLYDRNDPVGVGIVRKAAGVRGHDRVNKAIVVTTSRYTKPARTFAEEENHLIQLMDLDDLLRML